MKIKLIISLLVLCLAFSIGFTQALNDTDMTTENMTGNQTGNMTPANITNVSLVLESIQGIRNNNTTGDMWFVYINGEPAEEEFGKNNVTEGDLLSFWFTTEDKEDEENGENEENREDKEAIIENATYVVNVTIARAENQTQNMTDNMTGNMTGNMTDNMTDSMTGDMTDNQTGNMTDNMTGNMTGNMTDNMTGNMTGNMTDNMTGPMVLFNNTVNLTEGFFIFTPENSTQSYQAANFTDIGALNATGLQYNVSVMQMDMNGETSGTGDETDNTGGNDSNS